MKGCCVNVVGGRIDYMRAAEHLIVKYRTGKLGRMTLDNISDLNHNNNSVFR